MMRVVSTIFCLAIFATAATASRWGSTPAKPDDSVCQAILKKLSGLWDRKNKADSKVTLGRNGYKEMKVKRAKWGRGKAVTVDPTALRFIKISCSKRGKADHCKAMLCGALKKDVRCGKVVPPLHAKLTRKTRGNITQSLQINSTSKNAWMDKIAAARITSVRSILA